MKLWGQSTKGRSNGSSVVSAEGGPTEHSSEAASELDNLLVEETARRTNDFLITQGWCLWKCRTLGGEVIAVVLDENVEGVPEGYPVYTMAELEELCQDDISETTLRLVHEMKKIAGAKVTSIVTAMKEETDGEARIEVHLRKGDQEHHSLSGGARRRSPQQ